MTTSALMLIDTKDRSGWSEVDYVTAGEEVAGIKFMSQWMLGKLAYEYVQKWGDCSYYARQIHVDAKSLIAYKHVYKKIHEQDPDYVPDGYIPWGVIQMAADYDDPVGMIEELSANSKVSISEAYRYKKEKETGKSIPTKPKVSLKWNEDSQMWQMHMSEDDFKKIDWNLIGRQLSNYLKRLWGGQLP